MLKIEQTSMHDLKKRSMRGRGTDWVFWNGRAARFSDVAIKTAMLAVGTGGKFYTIDDGISTVRRWRDGVRMLNNAKIGC